ncbi:hypothetical protein N431DRAFT_381328 [Stipitochalara longipes BDJ]|nr:hypothetical protein N431DRAFT_381328 [Stipitochalara longipes BDJ]
MPESIGRDRARQIINEIVREHGFVKESTLQAIKSLVSQDARREVEEALLAKDIKIGSSVLTLAKNLYTSQARFVFELLQNADDNEYTRGQDPYVVFRICPDRIVIDCNEDGFTRQNLTAICDIGKSSKTASQGYIGEKGIGFKSVFMAAWKVHIQSGDFSFDFVHRKGDSGMGMITPIWQDQRDPDLPSELTRITLYLRDQSDPAERERDRRIINAQFRELQDTLLLFLRKLRKIEVSFHDEEGHQTEGTIYTLSKIKNSDTAIIERTCTDPAQNRKRIYHIVKHVARRLAKSENRDLSEAEERSRSYETSDIVLAFPVTPDSVPIIEPQEVFAFLPLKKMGFDFLIQADFVTSANRQDIVMTSQRNQGLIEAIADAFIAGVLQLCQHQTLQYQWMRYLPLENSYMWEGLWEDLVSSIKSKLQNLAVFRSLELSTRRTINDLCYRYGRDNDQHGAPLFADLRPEVYLSDSYVSKDIDILRNFGLGWLSYGKTIEMVARDLHAGPEHSKIKSPNTDEDWNTRAYNLLNRAYGKGGSRQSQYIRSLKQLDIIPLQDGSWVSSEIGDIFYPTYRDIAVPKDLKMRLVDPMATRNESRCAFFDNLGVKRINLLTMLDIRERILQQPTVPPMISSLESSVERMRFLFLTHNILSERDDLSGKFMVYNHLEVAMYPNIADLYISNDDPYGAELFLRQKGRQVSCVNSRYFEEISSVAPGSNLTLHQWMYKHLGIREHLRLVSSDRTSLSTQCLNTARTRPAEFLGFLGHLWPFESDIVLTTAPLLSDLKETDVLCINGERKELCETYLPLKPLLDVHRRFLGDECFPFIQLPELFDQDEVPHQWSFLVKNLGVGNQDNVSFRLQLMRSLKEANPDAETLDNPSRVVDLYQSIDACSRLSQNREASEHEILLSFENYELVFVPPWNSSPASWREPQECLWDAPSDFITAVPLKEIYISSFQDSNFELDHIAGFFRTLGIDDIDWPDVTYELEELKRQPTVTGEVVRRLYGILFEKSPTILEDDIQQIRESFETEALIYFDHNGTPGWHKPSECVWSDTTHIHGKIAVNAQYSDFKDLFIEKLQVPQLDLKMVLDQLLDARSLNLPVPEVKELLKTLNSFLRAEPNPPSPSRFLNARIFPVREPSSIDAILCTSKTQFALVDREGPPSRFREMVRVLDFTLQEIRQLKPLLSWARLESRYVSRCMRETSCLGDGVKAPISQTHRDLKRKSYALLRIAAAFNSPRYIADPLGFYHILHTAVTFESGVISSSLSLEQDGAVHEISVSQSELHIEDTNPLTIYVPNNAESQECCFKFDLPRRFASWMMSDPSTGTQGNIEDGTVNVINSILNCLISTTGRILEKEGIPEVPEVPEILEPIGGIEEPAESTTMAVAPDLGDQDERLLLTPTRSQRSERLSSPESIFSLPVTPQSTTHMESVPDHPTPLTDPEDYDSEDSLGTPNDDNSIRPPQFHIPAQQSLSEYRRLLEGVVSLARRTTLPINYGDISTIFQGLSIGDDPFEGLNYAYASNDWEHRKKIGVAGELFVFKILSSIHDLEFDLDNWRSNIRGYARVLPEYAGLRAWPEDETSDIVYDDINGVLTRLMISLGYLNADHWAGKTPKYNIEVKCTMGDCAMPCFVGQKQVNLMESSTNGPHGNENQTVVYALFRVFNLGKSSMGLKIYIDPAEQRRVGKLAFTSKTYSVVPTRR